MSIQLIGMDGKALNMRNISVLSIEFHDGLVIKPLRSAKLHLSWRNVTPLNALKNKGACTATLDASRIDDHTPVLDVFRHAYYKRGLNSVNKLTRKPAFDLRHLFEQTDRFKHVVFQAQADDNSYFLFHIENA